MMTFDGVLPAVREILESHTEWVEQHGPLFINRDLYGRVRLIVSSRLQNDPVSTDALQAIADQMAEKLGCHTLSSQDIIMFEEDIQTVLSESENLPFEGLTNVHLCDRLATDSRWTRIAPISETVPRIVFFSIKGGVGRSTALAAAAWSLAQAGKRVLVLDLDLESPGLSSALLPAERKPAYGITDWLVEDLLDNGQNLLEDLFATSTLSHDGEIFVAPAHGAHPGEYISKLGRVWMPRRGSHSAPEPWSQRLGRLIAQLEQRLNPDITLIDSRSGIDNIASTCVTDLGATMVLLFALDGEQTWSGYRILFDQWRAAGIATDIRERLQLVGAMTPEVDTTNYLIGLREQSWDLFSGTLYDDVPPGATTDALWNFAEDDEQAPHYPWAIRWNQGFAAITLLHHHLARIDADSVRAIFGPLNQGLARMLDQPGSNDNG